ncbi:MAG: hypothetical protein ACQEQG_08310 [Bacillota bacterium]
MAAHFNQGESGVKVGFVLSAPGRAEEENQRPAAGVTGDNLAIVVEYLQEHYPEIFPYTDIYSYTITNAVSEIHHVAKTGDTEGKDSSIVKTSNVERVYTEVADLDHLIFFGNKAQKLIVPLKKRGFDGNCYLARHLSLQSLNQVSIDLEGNRITGKDGAERREKRARVVAEKIKRQIAKKVE